MIDVNQGIKIFAAYLPHTIIGKLFRITDTKHLVVNKIKARTNNLYNCSKI